MSDGLLQGKAALRYERLEILGEGGMGSVYRAWDVNMVRRVVLKFPRKSATSNPKLLKRLRNEAFALAKIEHPNVLRLYDFEQNDGSPFIVTEDVDGKELRAIIDEGSLNPRESILLLIELSKGLQAAHEANILHRDIKPENILVTPKGIPKLIDFGLVLSKDDASCTRMTATGVVVGTLLYVAPEVLSGSSTATESSDIYSFGVVAYELLTGKHPYVGLPAMSLISIDETIPVIPPSKLNSAIDESLDKIILNAINRRPETRPRSIKEFRVRLSSWLTKSEVQSVIKTRAAKAISVETNESKGSLRKYFAIVLVITALSIWSVFYKEPVMTEAKRRALEVKTELKLFQLRDELISTNPILSGKKFDELVHLIPETSVRRKMGVGAEVSEKLCAICFLAQSSRKKIPAARSLRWYELLFIEDEMNTVFVRDTLIPEYVQIAIEANAALRVASFINENLRTLPRNSILLLFQRLLEKVVPKPDYDAKRAPKGSPSEDPMLSALRKKRDSIISLGENFLATIDQKRFETIMKLHIEFVTWTGRSDYRPNLNSLVELINGRQDVLWSSRMYLAMAYASIYQTEQSDVVVAKELLSKALESVPDEDKILMRSFQSLLISIHAETLHNNYKISVMMHEKAVAVSQKVLRECPLSSRHRSQVCLNHLITLNNLYYAKKKSREFLSFFFDLFDSIKKDEITFENRYLYFMGRGMIRDIQQRSKEASTDYNLSVYFAPHCRKGRALAVLYTQELLRGFVPSN